MNTTELDNKIKETIAEFVRSNEGEFVNAAAIGILQLNVITFTELCCIASGEESTE